MHNINRTLGVRKGTWTQEEDVLLKKCINKYGVGKWSQVPLRSGLNRCRKSCRLRWLNYLRPNIKRGSFTADEVDLMIRLHKLLGNRWSLIAGRLPERTANDVKNYWNTNLSKKPVASCREDHEKIKAKNANEEAKLVKPRPRIFAKNLPWLRGKTTIIDNNQSRDINVATPSPLGLFDSVDGILRLEDKVVDGGPGNAWPMSAPCYEPNIIGLWAQETSSGIMVGDTSDQEGPNGWTQFSMDNLWDLLTD